jgi:hypothetical protein
MTALRAAAALSGYCNSNSAASAATVAVANTADVTAFDMGTWGIRPMTKRLHQPNSRC